MKHQNELDIQIRQYIKAEMEAANNAVGMSNSTKEAVISNVSKPSSITIIKNKIVLLLDYEISVPVQIITVVLLLAVAVGYFFFISPMKVTAKDVESAKIHIVNSQGGDTDETHQN